MGVDIVYGNVVKILHLYILFLMKYQQYIQYLNEMILEVVHIWNVIWQKFNSLTKVSTILAVVVQRKRKLDLPLVNPIWNLHF